MAEMQTHSSLKIDNKMNNMIYGRSNSDPEALTKPLLEDEETKYCPVCTVDGKDMVRVPSCGHEFCRDCIRQYLELKISEAQVTSISCLTCSVQLPSEFFYPLINFTFIQKYEQFSKRYLLEQNPYIRWCPVPNCEGWDIKQNSSKLTCNKCSFEYCFNCSSKWHGSRACAKTTDKKFERWAAKKHVKFCPQCKRRVEKNGGCRHMTCLKCNYNWCWNCGRDIYDYNHNNFTCNFGNSVLDLYWYVLLALIFAPLFIPFAFLLVAVYRIDITGEFDGEENFTSRLVIKLKAWTYLILFMFSPLLVVLSILIGGFILSFALVANISPIWVRSYCIPFGLVLGLFLGVVLDLAITAATLLIMALAPLAGIVLLGFKILRKKRRQEFVYPRILA